jgi:hypothetical protein
LTRFHLIAASAHAEPTERKVNPLRSISGKNTLKPSTPFVLLDSGKSHRLGSVFKFFFSSFFIIREEVKIY